MTAAQEESLSRVEQGGIQENDSFFLTDIPYRLDRLPWQSFHSLIVLALGVTWILDGLEVTLVGALSSAIANRASLDLSSASVGLTASGYLGGAIVGALLFGRLTDFYGRRTLFFVTLSVYVVGALLSGLAWNFWSFLGFRIITGLGIGGEYAAINSAVQEFIPARYRGRTDLAINGSWWVGAAIGALGSIIVLNPRLFAPDIGWRVAFVIGAALALSVLFLRKLVPESPRWLLTHGRVDEAERIVERIEQQCVGLPPTAGVQAKLKLHILPAITLGRVSHMLLRMYPQRVLLGVTLMATQAFFYNAIFFTYALILSKYYDVPAEDVGWYILPFAAGNFLGPLLLGPLFDIIGRKVMIASTYALSGGLIILVGTLFVAQALSASEQTLLWSVIFFFASAGASAAYLTVGESFPVETRALVIALFYSFGTAVGGIAAPYIFGVLIDTGSRLAIMWGYLFGGILMVLAACVEGAIGLNAERRSLEDIAPPLSQAG